MAYTPGSVLVRAVMTSVTGLVEDQIVNDFAFEGGDVLDAAERSAIFSNVDRFYREPGTLLVSVGHYISRAISRAATHRLDMYQISAGGLGSPIDSIPWLGPDDPGNDQGVPTECAAVLSFHADFAGAVEEAAGGSRPKARRRGRLFIGPLHLNAVQSGTPPFRIHPDFLLTLREAGNRLIAESGANLTPWSVWSRVDATLRPVVGGWTDDAPDTQRRRGVNPTGRTVWGS